MAERQALRYQVLDSSGVPIAGASIQVAQLGTTTNITQTMYAGLTGGTTIANPLISDASGWVQAYFNGTDAVTLKRVTVIPTLTGYTFTTRNVQLGSDYGVLDDGVAPLTGTTVDATDRFNMARGSGGDPASLQTGDMWYNTTTNALHWRDNSGTQTVSTTTGDITGVTAGNGLTGGGASGDVTLNVGAGNAINVDANDVDVSVNAAASAVSALAGDDKILISDTNDSNTTKSATVSQIDPTLLNGGNNKVYYTDSSGDVTELALGAANTVLTSAGATSAPTFSGVSTLSGLFNEKILYTNNSGVLTELALGADGTALVGNGTTSAPTFGNITDIKGGNDKILYTNSSGVITELALGASGTVLTSAGATSAPSFAAAGGGGQWELIASDVGTTISTTATSTTVVKTFTSLSVPNTTPLKVAMQVHFDADGAGQNASVNAFLELNGTSTGGTGAYLATTTTADNERFYWVEAVIGGRESTDTNWRGYQTATFYGGTYNNGSNYYSAKPTYSGAGPDMDGTIVVDTITSVGIGMGSQGDHVDIRNIYLYKMIVS